MFLKLLPAFLMLMSTAAFYSQAPPIEPGVSHDLAIWRAARYSDVRYKLNLTLEKMSPVLKGTIEIRVKVGTRTPSSATPASAGGVAPIVLDWRKIRGHEDASTVSNVSINGTSVLLLPPQGRKADGGVRVPFEESNEHLIFRDGVVAGENVIKLDFTSPILTSGSAITRYIDKEDGSEYLYSLFVPSDASTAFPVFDQPDLKARFSLRVERPSDWEVVSNALGEDSETVFSEPNRSRAFHTDFVETKPISTYVFAFAAGPFERIGDSDLKTRNVRPELKEVYKKWIENDVSVSTSPEQVERMRKENIERLSRGFPSDSLDFPHIYVRKSQAEKFKPHAAETFRLMREGINYLEGYFDYKFPWPKYDLVLIPEFPFGGMEHAGATFVREQSIIFPTEPTKSDYINRATLIFHETAHQWFGDTVTMKWFDDLWLKEGFANFMAYKAMEKIMPEMNAWKVFYERIKQPAYATDSTKGTTPIYQPIANLSAAKSAYGNIVYNKAPAFLRQAEFYLGEDKFQTAVRAFLKKHEYSNATWEDLVKEFELAPGGNVSIPKKLDSWAKGWVKRPGVTIVHTLTGGSSPGFQGNDPTSNDLQVVQYQPWQSIPTDDPAMPVSLNFKLLAVFEDGSKEIRNTGIPASASNVTEYLHVKSQVIFAFPNYQDYGYGIFLLDDKSRDYVLKNVQNEKDPFLRSMMYGALWDSVREGELDPKDYVELAIKNLPAEQDENITASILGRALTALNYYLSEPPASAGGQKRAQDRLNWPAANAAFGDLRTRLEAVLINRMQNAPTLGQRITFYRASLNAASSENARNVLKRMLAATTSTAPAAKPATPPNQGGELKSLPLKTKDRFDIVTRLAVLGDPDAPKLLADLEKTETSDDAKRYAYAAHAAFATKENREKFWNDFTANKTISESWIEAAMGPFNSIRHDDLSLPYLQRALAELPNLKRDRKIFFVNGWLGAFIGGQKSQEALDIVNKFLADNPNLDNDLRLKILENVDLLERAVKIRGRYAAAP